MVMKKSAPTLRRLTPGFGTILPDSCRRRFQSQFGQFVANARAASSRVEGPHPPDELDQLRVLSRSPESAPRLPQPEHPESSSLPADEVRARRLSKGFSN